MEEEIEGSLEQIEQTPEYKVVIKVDHREKIPIIKYLQDTINEHKLIDESTNILVEVQKTTLDEHGDYLISIEKTNSAGQVEITHMYNYEKKSCIDFKQSYISKSMQLELKHLIDFRNSNKVRNTGIILTYTKDDEQNRDETGFNLHNMMLVMSGYEDNSGFKNMLVPVDYGKGIISQPQPVHSEDEEENYETAKINEEITPEDTKQIAEAKALAYYLYIKVRTCYNKLKSELEREDKALKISEASKPAEATDSHCMAIENRVPVLPKFNPFEEEMWRSHKTMAEKKIEKVKKSFKNIPDFMFCACVLNFINGLSFDRCRHIAKSFNNSTLQLIKELETNKQATIDKIQTSSANYFEKKIPAKTIDDLSNKLLYADSKDGIIKPSEVVESDE